MAAKFKTYKFSLRLPQRWLYVDLLLHSWDAPPISTRAVCSRGWAWIKRKLSPRHLLMRLGYVPSEWMTLWYEEGRRSIDNREAHK